MGDKVTVKVDLHGVEEELLQVGPRIAKRLLRRALRAVGKIAVENVKSHIEAVDTGALRDSIDFVIKTSNSSDSATLEVGPTYDKKTVKPGQKSPGVYGMFVEFGLKTKKYPRQPFMRPTFDTDAERWIQIFADGLREDLEEAVKP